MMEADGNWRLLAAEEDAMTIVKLLKGAWTSLLGRVVVDDRARALEGPLLLFVSDTPSSFYPELQRLLNLLLPAYLVHTGDLADELKLQIYPRLRSVYAQAMVRLFRVLRQSSLQEAVLTLGNHDVAQEVDWLAGVGGATSSLTKGVLRVFPSGGVVVLEGKRIVAAHYHQQAQALEAALHKDQGLRPDLVLFGHDLETRSEQREGIWRLNGIEAIYLISLSTGEVIGLPYPSGTDNARLNRHKIGL